MPSQDSSTSPARRVLDRVLEERFTGLLRVSSHEASGEFWFLAGTLEEGRFGVSKGEEAIERLLRATQAVFQAELRLPYVNGGFKKPMPASGTFAEFRPVVLMRHCESYALTCSLVLRGKDRTVRLTYRLGELLSEDTAGAGNAALPALLESEEGSYEFTLPTFELPEGVNTPVAASASKLPLAERIDRLLAEEAAAEADTKTLAEPAAAAEAKRKADEAAAAKAKREREAFEAAEAKRNAEQAAAAEAKRKADEAAEAKRKADEAAEAKRKADVAAEAKRKADEAAEAKRKADEAAEAKRKADEAAEAKRKADVAAEAKRKADVAAAAKAKREREALEAAEAKKEVEPTGALQSASSSALSEAEPEPKAAARQSEPAAAESSRQSGEPVAVATRKGGFPWFWLFLLLLVSGLAYFIKERLGPR